METSPSHLLNSFRVMFSRKTLLLLFICLFVFSDKLSSCCEGKITFQECESILVPFNWVKRLELIAFQ